MSASSSSSSAANVDENIRAGTDVLTWRDTATQTQHSKVAFIYRTAQSNNINQAAAQRNVKAFSVYIVTSKEPVSPARVTVKGPGSNATSLAYDRGYVGQSDALQYFECMQYAEADLPYTLRQKAYDPLKSLRKLPKSITYLGLASASEHSVGLGHPISSDTVTPLNAIPPIVIGAPVIQDGSYSDVVGRVTGVVNGAVASSGTDATVAGQAVADNRSLKFYPLTADDLNKLKA